MKKLLIILVCCFILACSNTKLTISWTQENLKAENYKNIGFAALLPADANRLLFEESLVNEFKKKRINATITFYNFPLANKNDLIENLNYSPEKFNKIILEKINARNFDA